MALKTKAQPALVVAGKKPSSPKTTGLKERFFAKLAESKLDDPKLIQKLGLELLDAAGIAANGILPSVAGFKIPYFDATGKKTNFFRVRFLEDTRTGLARLTDAKAQRYGQVAGTLNEAYFPPTTNWADIAADTTRPVWITEGELKAACGSSMGIPVIGLGGVWCFRSNKNDKLIIDDIAEFPWTGRPVYVCYDSDASSNPQVMAAEDALCNELVRLGGRPHVVRLPAKPNGYKNGLDDYLVECGPVALTGLAHMAHEYNMSRELHKMNQEMVYVRNPGFVVQVHSFQRMKPSDLCAHAFADRFAQVKVGEKVVRISAPKAWIQWPARACVDKMIFAPGQGVFTQGEKGEPCLNTWRGWGCDAKKGDVSLWDKFMEYTFSREPGARKWFEQWLAYPIQHPGTKLFTAVVIWGRTQGTGKSFIGYSMKQIYGENFQELEPDMLASTFNGWAERCQFVMGDEITGGEGNRKMADRLKSLITRKTCMVNEKNLPAYTIQDRTNYYFTSNHPDAFYLEDTDRRFFVLEAPSEPLPTSFYKEYEKWIYSKAGAEALRFHLENIDLTGFSPSERAPVTIAKTAMVNDSQSELGSWVRGVRDDPDTWLRAAGTTIKHSLFTAMDLLLIFDPDNRKRVTMNGMSRELKKAGILCIGHRPTVNGNQILWRIRNVQCRAGEEGTVYDTERGHVKGKANGKKF